LARVHQTSASHLIGNILEIVLIGDDIVEILHLLALVELILGILLVMPANTAQLLGVLGTTA
jgi:hypothetical protein